MKLAVLMSIAVIVYYYLFLLIFILIDSLQTPNEITTKKQLVNLLLLPFKCILQVVIFIFKILY